MARARDLRRGRKEKEQARGQRGAAGAPARKTGAAAARRGAAGDRRRGPRRPDDRAPPAAAAEETGARGAPSRPAPAAAYVLPPLDLLDDPPADRVPVSRDEILANSRILERKLADFGVNGKVTQVHPGR